MAWTLLEAHRWTEYGTKLLDEQIATLGEEAAREPSSLPNWTRKALIAHICGNADALGNLVRWAATGVETPMYASKEQRQRDIDAGDTMTIRDLLGWFGRSVDALAYGMDHLTPQQWESPIVTAQGRTVPATTIPWLRAREVMVHAVDLGTGVRFSDLPEDFLIALCDDIVIKRNAGAHAPVGVVAVAEGASGTGTVFKVRGATSGEELPIVHGDLPAVAAYLAGRPIDSEALRVDGNAPPPHLGAWL